MNIIFVLLSTLIILSCSQPNGGYRWLGGYEHEGYSGKHYIGSKNGWRNIGKNYAYGNNGNNNGNGNIESNNGNRNIVSNNGNDYIGSINGNGNIGRNNRNGNTGINKGNSNIGNGEQWGQWGLLESNRPLSCKKNNFCRVFVGVFLPKNSPSSLVEIEICNSQNRCMYAVTMGIYGTFCRGMRDIPNRSPSEYTMVSYEVTQIFRKEAIFKGEGEGDVTARISSIESPCIITIGLDPVMIWRYDGGVMGGTAYLPEGSRREDYGTQLDRFDNVVENIVGDKFDNVVKNIVG